MVAIVNFQFIEKKWQKRWEKEKLFQANVDKREKFFTSIVIPYVNGDVHVGHSYTYIRSDVYARFKRLFGKNVLLAQAYHATGEPIVGAIKRLKNGDKGQAATFKLFGATNKDLENFRKKGPKYAANFWGNKITESSKSAGFSVDWRRKFTLSVDPQFSRFIEWQYNTLRKKGYVVQGTHPVVWCPNDQSPTGDHDRLEGEGESPVDYVLLKFACGGYVLPAATLRPETIYGVTNMWLNPDADYVEMMVGDERWVVSKRAAEKLKDQMDAEVVGHIDAKEFIGKRCINPVTNQEVPVLPADFVDPDSATGVVMSVPSHAPYDWVALKEMIDNDQLQEYGTDKNRVEPISVVNLEGFGEHPAIDIVGQMKITSLKQKDKLDDATNTIYKKEFHGGVLRENCGEYAGMKVSEVKDRLVRDFIENNVADIMWEITGRVVCRCTTECHVKILENQWFLKFSDEKWKEKVRKHLKTMNIYPEEARNNFEKTIDWLQDKACTRKSGLGTKLPWDKDWIVETLSDSTIYMAYYTIAGIINAKKISAEKLTDEVFDYIFLGKGDLAKISNKSKLSKKLIENMRSEFEYFYPMDLRNSGKDLVQNHLTFYLFHHVAIFPKDKWPRAISVNGFVNVEGEKMSKSKGNIIPLRNLVDQYGADLTRINITCSSEGIDDADWRAENIKGYRNRLDFLFDVVKEIKKAKGTKKGNAELWLISRMQNHVSGATTNHEVLKYRTACQHALFEPVSDLKWYLRRVGGIEKANGKVLRTFLDATIKMISPFTPHLGEEMWSVLGNKKSIYHSQWPEANKSLISAEAEMGEAMIESVLSDIEKIQKIAKMKGEKVIIFVADKWKFEVYNKVMKSKDKSINDITKEIMKTSRYGKATVNFIQSLYKKKEELVPLMSKTDQTELLRNAKEFMERETGLKVNITDADKSDDQKAKQSTPQKFGILIE